MQDFYDEGSMNEDLIELEGQFCETTRRIVIISPFPAAIRYLVMALTIRCYDVIIFHHENDPALATIQSDFVIIDRTKAVAVKSYVSTKGKAVLVLVGDESEMLTGEYESLLWPCPVKVVLEKVDTMVSQLDSTQPASEILKYKDITVDIKRVTVSKMGKSIDLTKTEFELLKLLLTVGGAVLTREEIMRELWGDHYFGGSNSVDVHIKDLRHKLGDDPKNPRYITTVRGIGYRISD